MPGISEVPGTFQNRHSQLGRPLGQAGADYNSAIESSVLFTATTPMPSFQYWDLTSLTRQWLNGAANNYGVILLADNENQIAHDLRFHSADSMPNSVNQPVLEVVWTQQQRSVYYLKDHLGSVRASVDDNGQLLSRDDYDPWGLQLAGRSMTAQPNLPNKFTGKEWDDDFGLNVYHIGARRYDPEIGRWWSVDPSAKQLPGLSPYNYVRDNPLLRVDPDGRMDLPGLLGDLFNIQTPQQATESGPSFAVENIQNTANAISGEVNSAISENVIEPINQATEVAVDAAQEGTITATAVVAPALDQAGTALVAMAPMAAVLGPEGPPAFTAAAGVAKGLSFTAKAVNTAVGGKNFTTADMVGDLANIIGGQLVPGVGPAGVLELIDAGIDRIGTQQKGHKK